MPEQVLTHPFAPIIDANSKMLILGSFPSIDSFSNAFYYAHKRNQFWPLMAEIFSCKLESIEQKKQLAFEQKIALWDIVKSCTRTGSLDSNLKVKEPNDIEALLKEYPSIEAIFCNGGKAFKIYQKHFKHLDIPAIKLPSPSPANCIYSFQDKLEIYKRELLPYI